MLLLRNRMNVNFSKLLRTIGKYERLKRTKPFELILCLVHVLFIRTIGKFLTNDLTDDLSTFVETKWLILYENSNAIKINRNEYKYTTLE